MTCLVNDTGSIMTYLMNGVHAVMTHLVNDMQARHSGSAMCLNSLACRQRYDTSCA